MKGIAQCSSEVGTSRLLSSLDSLKDRLSLGLKGIPIYPYPLTLRQFCSVFTILFSASPACPEIICGNVKKLSLSTS